jgi:cob(I)alamin adenosyltransferase
MSASASSGRGLLIVYTGNGKGKTTAALGLAMRAMGRGQQVGMVQFLKGKWQTGERLMAKSLPLLNLFVMGEGFTWESDDLSRDQKAAQRAWQRVCDLLADPEHPIVICDEISYAINYGFLDEADVLEVISSRPAGKHLVLTGRHIPESLIAMADLVTDMTSVKHPFDQGRRAEPAIDY